MPKGLSEKLSKTGEVLEFSMALLLILIGAILRILPHPPNFAPIAAIALFGGSYISRRWALTLPVLSMLLSDIFIGFYEPLLMASVYGSFVLCGVLGLWLRKHKRWYAVSGISILGSVLFFLVTNFAVWAFTPWYPKTPLGITQCYIMALPFFRNSLLGNLFYTIVLFGAYEIVRVGIRKKFTVAKTAPSLY